jgi:hypothetical protein
MNHDFAYGARQEFLRPRMSWEIKLALCFLAAAILIALSTEVFGAERYATTQSREPWKIQQCDKLMKRPAVAVFNVSTWNAGGWPLWRVLCAY